MLLIKDIKKKLRERRTRIEKDYLVYEFILKMREHNIVLSQKEEYLLECHDLNISHDINTFEFDIRNDSLAINYNNKPNLISNVFNGYFNIKYENNDISLEKIFRRIIGNLSIMNNEYHQLLRIDERKGYIELEKTSVVNGYFSITSFMGFLYPRICFKKGTLEKSIVLDCYTKISPFEELSGANRHMFINIIDQEKSYDIAICEQTIYNKIHTFSVLKESDFESIMIKILNIIKSVGLTEKAREIIEIDDWREFNEEKAETLRMLYY